MSSTGVLSFKGTLLVLASRLFFLDVQIMNTPPKQCSVRDVLQSFLKWGQATGHLRKRSSDHVLVEHEDKRNYPELKQL